MSAISRALSTLSRRVNVQGMFARSLSMQAAAPRILSPAFIQSQSQTRQLSSNSLSKVQTELQDFLSAEIQAEKEAAKVLPKLEGWNISHDGSEITLTKTYGPEEITIKANICYSVEEQNPEGADQDAPSEMVCKPDFAIEIKKGGQILGLNCTFYREEEGEEQSSVDDIQINEISIYEGEFQKSNYAISGDVIDGNLYDMLMNVLEERGVDFEFAKQFIQYSTAYEHKQYVGLLSQMKKFFA